MRLSIHQSVCPQGGYPYPIMLCNISQNAMRRGGPVRYPPWGGTRVRYPRGGTQVQVPPGGGTRTPPGGYPGPGNPPWGGTWVRYPPRGGTRVRYPPRGGTQVWVPPRGGTRVGQQKEYSLHGGRYASCVHAGGLSCSSYLHSEKYVGLTVMMTSLQQISFPMPTSQLAHLIASFHFCPLHVLFSDAGSILLLNYR